MKKLFAIQLLALVSFFAMNAFADPDTETDANSVILAGHDAVAYFTQSKPVQGSAKFTAVHNEAVYRFSSAKNRDLFRANPAKFAPVYGGFCAYGTTFGKKFEIDGKAFEIVNGRLYVNKNLSVYETWRKDIPGNIVTADEKWPEIRDVPADLL